MIPDFGNGGYPTDLCASYDNNVDRRHGGNVFKGDHMVVFVDDVSRDLSVDDLGE